MKKRNELRRKEVFVITFMVIMTSFLYVNADYEPQTSIVGIVLSSSDMSINSSQFNATIYLNPDTTPDAWVIYTLSYKNESGNAGILNISTSDDVTIGPNWLSMFMSTGSFDNSTGELSNPQAMIPYGISGNNTIVIVNFTPVGVGTCYINFDNVVAQYEGGDIPLTPVNATVVVRPANVTSNSAEKINASAIKLIWNQSAYIGTDNCVIRYNTSGYPSTVEDGLLAYNGSGDPYTSGRRQFNQTGLDENTTYFYRMWAWNESEKLYSSQGMMAYNTTDDVPNITGRLVSNADYNGAYWFLYSDYGNGHAKLVVSYNDDLTSPVVTAWQNSSTFMGAPYYYRYQFQDNANSFNANSTIYYRLWIYDSADTYYDNTSIHSVALWSPNITLNAPLNGITHQNATLTTLNISVDTPIGVNFTVKFFEGHYYSQSELYTTGGNNGTYTYDWTNLDYYTTYHWGIQIDTNDTEDGGNISTRRAFADMYGSSPYEWTFRTEEAPLNVSIPYPPDDGTELTRPPANLSVYISGSNVSVQIRFRNNTPFGGVWTLVQTFNNVNSSRINVTNLDTFGIDTEFIWGNTTYNWWVNASNGTAWINRSYNYTTNSLIGVKNARYDIDNDGANINVLDLSAVWGNRTFDETAEYNGMYDVTGDAQVNVLDSSLVWGSKTI